MKPDTARTLLMSNQQLRTHWSGVINAYINYAIIANVAIWSYFLTTSLSFITSGQNSRGLWHIALAALISSITISLWRLYSHRIDNAITGLYPEFVFCEDTLLVPSDYGMRGYLKRGVCKKKDVKEQLTEKLLENNNLTAEQKSRAIKWLVDNKRIGDRGHFRLDLSVFIGISGMLVFTIVKLGDIMLFHKPSTLVFLVTIAAFGVFSGMQTFYCNQKEPSEKNIQDALKK